MINKLYSVSSCASCYELEFNNARALVIVKKNNKKKYGVVKKYLKTMPELLCIFPSNSKNVFTCICNI